MTTIFDNFDQKLDSSLEKQLELASQIRNHGHGNKHRIDNLTSEVTQSKTDLKLMGQKMKTFQQQQIQITTRIDGHDRDVDILKSNLTVTRNNLSNIFDNFDQKLNSTQEKQLVLASDIRNHGHGNKKLIDNLASQVTKSTNDLKLIEKRVDTQSVIIKGGSSLSSVSQFR